MDATNLSHLSVFHSVSNRTRKALISSAALCCNSFFSRARDCMPFMLHDLTVFYVERDNCIKISYCIKINDHS